MLDSFLRYWQSAGLPKRDTPLLLAVSGGVDSMVLVHLCKAAEFVFQVAHCNFQLRGSEADLDEQLVAGLCAAEAIPFHSQRFATQVVAAEWRKGTQETARKLRYDWFQELCTTHKLAYVVTAHHLDDNVETVLMNLFRGTGIAGMHGILPINGNILRPLLFARKSELVDFATKRQIAYRNDASNETDDYTRNAIRRHVIPAIEQWLPDASLRISESSNRIAEAELLYKKAVDLEKRRLIEQRGNDHYIPLRKLRHCTPLSTIVYELLVPFGFAPQQINGVLKLMEAESGHYISSPTHRLIKNRDFFIITTLSTDTADVVVLERLPAVVQLGSYTYECTVQEVPKTLNVDINTAILDEKALESPLLLRKWKTGDYFYPLGMAMKKKKVSRLLINEKVALHDKEQIVVLESDKRIAWVAGLRIDERFKVKPSTQKVVIIKRRPAIIG
jgi:tRNA(Ile)-lysidine synthase